MKDVNVRYKSGSKCKLYKWIFYVREEEWIFKKGERWRGRRRTTLREERKMRGIHK